MIAHTVKVSSKRQITIPVSCKNVREGDTLLLLSKGDDIMLKPLEEVIEAVFPARMTERSLRDWDSEEDERAYAKFQ